MSEMCKLKIMGGKVCFFPYKFALPTETATVTCLDTQPPRYENYITKINKMCQNIKHSDMLLYTEQNLQKQIGTCNPKVDEAKRNHLTVDRVVFGISKHSLDLAVLVLCKSLQTSLNVASVVVQCGRS